MNRSLMMLAALTLFACDETDPPADGDWELQEHVDDGDLCASGGGVDPVAISVTVQDCMSSSCSRAFVGECSATLSGSVITVTSDISWEDNVAPNATCTDDCGIPMASCELTGVPDGTYTVMLGAQSLTVVLPSTDACSPF